jgi:hypothetical protein
MKRLGELLIERGAIAVSELHTALEATRRLGGRLGTHLLKYGYVEEKDLLSALAEQFQVSSVNRDALEEAPVDVIGLIDGQAQTRFLAIPFAKDKGRLKVAMANPRDQIALEELATRSGLTIEPYVTSEAIINKALETVVSKAFKNLEGGDIAQVEKSKPLETANWEDLWMPTRISQDTLFRVELPKPRRTSDVLLASFPGLAPMIDTSVMDEQTEIDEETFIARLREVNVRDDVGDLLMRYAAKYLSRLALFSVHKDQVMGWMVHGEAVVLDDVQSFNASLEKQSIFKQMYTTGGHVLGALAIGPVNDQLVAVLGEPKPLEVVGVPLKIKNRPVAFLVGDIPGQSVDDVPVRELLSATDRAGVALEVLILKIKMTR